jgi:hypothetical protein
MVSAKNQMRGKMGLNILDIHLMSAIVSIPWSSGMPTKRKLNSVSFVGLAAVLMAGTGALGICPLWDLPGAGNAS